MGSSLEADVHVWLKSIGFSELGWEFKNNLSETALKRFSYP